MATTQVVQTSALPSAFESFYKTGLTAAESPTKTAIPGLIPQAFSLYGKGTPADFETIYKKPLEAAGLYGSGRIAGLQANQTAVGNALSGMTTPGQFATGTSATTSGIAGLQNLLKLAPQTISAPSLQQFQMGPAAAVSGLNFQSPEMMAAQTGFAPNLQQFQMGPAQEVSSQGVSAQDIMAAQTGFLPQLERFQMTAPATFSADVAQQYMSPYQQAVTDIAKRQAIEDAQRAQLSSNLAAGRTGTLGTSGQLLETAERERGLQRQLGDIQTRGLESAFGQAQQQFERDRAATMAAQKENLQAALGVQQLGTTTGLQTALANLTNEQQARVQSEANRLQASGMTQDAALKAALANQQAGLTTGQQNLAAQLATQQLGTQTGLQAALANLDKAQQAAVQNQAAMLQTQGLNADQAIRAALANQQAGLTVGQQNLQALLGIQQLGAGQSMEAQRANQEAALRAADQQRLAALGLGTVGQQLGQLGVAQQSMDLDRLKALGAFGDLQRALEQQKLDTRYADLMRAIQFPESQLEKLSGFIRGVPTTDVIQTTTAPPPSFASQLAGLGLSGLSVANLLGGRS